MGQGVQSDQRSLFMKGWCGEERSRDGSSKRDMCDGCCGATELTGSCVCVV